MLVPPSVNTDTVFSHFVIWKSMSPLSYYNGSQRIQNSKQAAAGTTRKIKFTIPAALEIIKTSKCYMPVLILEHTRLDCWPSMVHSVEQKSIGLKWFKIF